jgi:hypothetical protein
MSEDRVFGITGELPPQHETSMAKSRFDENWYAFGWQLARVIFYLVHWKSAVLGIAVFGAYKFTH